MKQVLLVFLGGGFGSVLRYLISKKFIWDSLHFPWATFSANLIGSFVIGFVFGYILVKNKLSDDLFLFLVAGFCGGFTTFSTFARESLMMLKLGNYSMFSTYLLSSIGVGLVCVWLGYIISAKVFM